MAFLKNLCFGEANDLLAMCFLNWPGLGMQKLRKIGNPFYGQKYANHEHK
jgi:hypothetical protein